MNNPVGTMHDLEFEARTRVYNKRMNRTLLKFIILFFIISIFIAIFTELYFNYNWTMIFVIPFMILCILMMAKQVKNLRKVEKEYERFLKAYQNSLMEINKAFIYFRAS